MSSVSTKGHRHTRSTALPTTDVLPSQNPQNPHHLNSQAFNISSQSDVDSSPQPTTPPQTPRRKDHNQLPSHRATPNAPETGSKKKPRNQRPKNVNTSPALTRNGRPSPPLAGPQSAGLPPKPISTPSTTAYAGPTFHASPAPSALPIPSFYSKSVPDSPGFKNLKNPKESPLSPKPLISTNGTTQHESPLDVFFRADREEKARARSASSALTAAAGTGPFQPPSRPAQTSQTPPISASQNKLRHGNKRMSSGGIFAMELDGESSPGAPYGPAFSTPYSERINAARAASTSDLGRDVNQNSSSEALKAYLFSGHQLPSPAATTPGSDGSSSPLTPTSGVKHRNTPASSELRNPISRAQSYGVSVRSSGLRQEVTPSTTPTKNPDLSINYPTSPIPVRRYGTTSSSHNHMNMAKYTPQTTSPPPSSASGVTSGNRSADILGMEDSLRRILKLDPAGPVNGNLTSATTSVPNYSGGRPPPMNGLHNGVIGS